MTTMLEARGLTKRYGGFLALDRVDFRVRRGEILGYLGPNGSGKSTTVNTVVGLIDPSAGSLWLDGAPIADDPVAYKRRIGYVPEEPHLYTHLTAIEYLMLVGRLRGLSETTLAQKDSGASAAAAPVGQPLRDDGRVLERYAPARAVCGGADAQPGSPRPRRAVLRAGRHGEPALSDAAAHVRGRRSHGAVQHAPIRHGREALLARGDPVEGPHRRRARHGVVP